MWYGYERWEEGNMLRRIADVSVPGKRWRGRQKTRWKDSCTDMESAYIGQEVEDVMDMTKWKK